MNVFRKRTFIALILAVFMLAGLFACGGEDKTPGGDQSAEISQSEGQEQSSALTRYTISYELDGGTADNPTSYTEEDEITLRSPIKSGYTFIGWTYDGKTEPELSVRIAKGSTGDKAFTAHYELYNEEQADSLKVAIFADIQLTTGDKQAGSVANAVLALRDHFAYAKSIGADVLFMPGDIINDAIEGYYELYESIFEEIYGEDESLYPEIVFNMGNHEWWQAGGGDGPEAVTLFKKYARIESPNLVKTSSSPYYLKASETLPSYYKVIKGVPFLVVSADNSNGEIGASLQAEIRSWLREIAELDSVKRGGPIFVSYHYPIPDVTFKGEHAVEKCRTIDELLKDYPSAVIFTGDTHFSGVNERTINQIDYTSINIGSSSYSRSISESATGYLFDNVNKGVGKSSAGTIKGDVSFKYEYTPTIMVADITADKTTINRYFTADDIADVKKVGMTWEIPLITDKNHFTYTDERVQNTAWANKLYGKDGLTWANGETVSYAVDGSKMIVSFNDVTDHNCVEHYRIKVSDTADATNYKYYDFLSHYYKYESAAHSYNFVLENIPAASNYTVSVTAYDFFDNPSTKVLTSSEADGALAFPDAIDVRTLETYSDISRIVNYTEKAEGSNSSVEFYYRGTKNFRAGMLLNKIILENSTATLKDLLSVVDWSDAALTFKVKNPNDFEIYFGLTLVTRINGVEKWITDGGKEFRVTVPAHSDWTTIKWSLSKQFGITDDVISNLAIKVFVPDSVVNTSTGYEFGFYLDDVDVVSDSIMIPHEYKMKNTLGEAFYGTNVLSGDLNSLLTLEYQLVTPAENAENSSFGFMVYDGTVWANYVKYIVFNPYTNTSSLDYVTITELEDGWYKLTVDLSAAEVVGDRNALAASTLTSVYSPSHQANCVIYLDSFKLEPLPKHRALYGNTTGDPTKLNAFAASTTDVLKFAYKVESLNDNNETASSFAFMIFDGADWSNWLDYVSINVYSHMSDNEGVYITADDDGWYDVMIELDKLNIVGDKATVDGKTLSAVYFHPDRQSSVVSLTAFSMEQSPEHINAFSNSLTDGVSKADLFVADTTKTLSFSYKVKKLNEEKPSSSRFAFMIYNGKDWSNYLSYVTINVYTNTSSTEGVTITEGENGWYNVTIDLSEVSVVGDKAIVDGYTLTSIYLQASRQTAIVYLDDFNAE